MLGRLKGIFDILFDLIPAYYYQGNSASNATMKIKNKNEIRRKPLPNIICSTNSASGEDHINPENNKMTFRKTPYSTEQAEAINMPRVTTNTNSYKESQIVIWNSEEDEEFVNTLLEDFEKRNINGHIDKFSEIGYGQRYYENLVSVIKTCDIFLIFITESFIEDQYFKDYSEIVHSFMSKRKIIPIWRLQKQHKNDRMTVFYNVKGFDLFSDDWMENRYLFGQHMQKLLHQP